MQIIGTRLEKRCMGVMGEDLPRRGSLLRAGADPNVLDDNGMTALDWAESSGQTQIAALLREHGGRNG